MNAYVDGLEVNIESVTVRGLGYGQPVQGKLYMVLLRLTKPELKSLFEDLYTSFIGETKAEVEQGWEVDPPSLGEANYPAWDELVSRYPRVLKEVLLEYLPLDFLERALHGNEKFPGCRYVINDLTGLVVRGGGSEFEIVGEAFERTGVSSK